MPAAAGASTAGLVRHIRRLARAGVAGLADIKGILFDKDGTLVDFQTTWFAIGDLLALQAADGDRTRADALLAEAGYDFAARRFRANSVFAAGTNADIVALWYPHGERDGTRQAMVAGFDIFTADEGAAKSVAAAGRPGGHRQPPRAPASGWASPPTIRPRRRKDAAGARRRADVRRRLWLRRRRQSQAGAGRHPAPSATSPASEPSEIADGRRQPPRSRNGAGRRRRPGRRRAVGHRHARNARAAGRRGAQLRSPICRAIWPTRVRGCALSPPRSSSRHRWSESRFFKSEMPIERPGAVILCMHDEGADPAMSAACNMRRMASRINLPSALACHRLHRSGGKQLDRPGCSGKSVISSGIGMAYFADDERSRSRQRTSSERPHSSAMRLPADSQASKRIRTG